MGRLADVAPYAVGFIAVGIVLLCAGVLIAKALMGPERWSYDDSCPEWVAVEHTHSRVCPDPVCTRRVWTPCPHRRPCPLHDTTHMRGRP